MNSRNFDLRHSEFSPNRIPQFMINNRYKVEKQSVASSDDDTKDTYSMLFGTFKSPMKPIKRKNSFSETQQSVSGLNIKQQEKLRNTFSPNHGLFQRIRACETNTHEPLFTNRLSPHRQFSNIEDTLDSLQLRIKNARSQMFKKAKPQESNTQVPIYNPVNENNLPNGSQSKNQKKNLRSSFLSDQKLSIHGHTLKINPYSGEHIYYVSELLRAKNQKNSIAMEHLSQSMKVIKNLSDIVVPRSYEIQEHKLNLKKNSMYEGKKTLIFDLDQTLIHCTENTECQCDIILTIKPKGQRPSQVRINIRPYALTLLQRLYKQFELIIFTASQPCYADVVLDYLDPQNKLFQHRLYREHCYNSEQGYIKDLRIINRPLSQMVIIDNSTFSYCLQLQNAIPILPYYQGDHDFEFKALEKYFMRLKNCEDVREFNKNTFKLHQYDKFQSTQDLIRQLYSNK